MLRDLLERFAECLWYGKRGLGFALCVPLLGPWTLITWVLSRRRLHLRTSLVATSRWEIPVIAVGNLAVGGTGKTQVVLALARQAQASGRRIGIVARGHGSARSGPAIVPADGDALEFGDEPVLLARRLPEATVVISRERAPGMALALSRGCELVLLDDGFQQTAVIPAAQVLVFGAESPLGNGALLPLGPLRDPLGVLRGDELIWLHGEGTGSVLPRVDVRSRTVPATAELRTRPVFAFAGIARPERFFRTLGQIGATVVGTARFADHRRLDSRELERLASRAVSLGAQVLVCTEKDAVRLPRAATALPVLTLETRLEIVEGQAAVERLLRG